MRPMEYSGSPLAAIAKEGASLLMNMAIIDDGSRQNANVIAVPKARLTLRL